MVVIIPALVAAFPFMLIGLACLVAVIRVDPAKLPKLVKHIAKSLRSRRK